MTAVTATTTTVPILDLAAFVAGDSVSRRQFVDALRDAAHRVGFFYLRGYGASQLQTKAVLRAARAFFALPDAQKHAVHMAQSPHFRGYTAAGDEITRGARDWREQLDIGAERAPLGHQASALQPAWARLQGPNQWPHALPAFKPLLLGWQNTLTQSAQQLLQALALALGQDEDYFDAPFADAPVQHLKIIRYPGRAAGAQGVGAHKDSGCITLLLQDNTQTGLQVLEREGPGEPRWIDVPPLEGTVVVNLGEVLEILTDGYLRATTHRVVSPRPGTARLSVAFFLSPRLDAELQGVPLPDHLARHARGVDVDPLNPLIPHTGSNLLKGRLRSHPEVAQRFYGDVLQRSAA